MFNVVVFIVVGLVGGMLFKEIGIFCDIDIFIN